MNFTPEYVKLKRCADLQAIHTVYTIPEHEMNEASQYCYSRYVLDDHQYYSYRQYTVKQDKLIYEYDVRNMQTKLEQ